MSDAVLMVGKGKRPRDTNQLAKWIVDQSTGELPDPNSAKNQATVALGGSLNSRAEARESKLSPRKPREIAKKAANSRWSSHS